MLFLGGKYTCVCFYSVSNTVYWRGFSWAVLPSNHILGGLSYRVTGYSLALEKVPKDLVTVSVYTSPLLDNGTLQDKVLDCEKFFFL